MHDNLLIFSDLDGTLLNHFDYSFNAASEALKVLERANIPLIISTSKTFAEVCKLQKELGIRAPFIVENGAGVFIPSDSDLAQEDWHKQEKEWIKVSQAKSYLESRLFLNAMKEKYQLRGFGDMDLKEVVKLTGLQADKAKDAKKRDFTEPFIMQDESQMPALKEEANAMGFDVVLGGRFYHLITLDYDKASAMQSLKVLYEEYYKKGFKTIALGDSSNDFSMIQAADHGILIPKHNGSYANLHFEGLIKAPFAGPKGWNSAILGILNAD